MTQNIPETIYDPTPAERETTHHAMSQAEEHWAYTFIRTHYPLAFDHSARYIHNLRHLDEQRHGTRP